ncbi:MAG: hypothetical protein ACRCTI_19280 [Beijerinckiaceae bacterium]
MRNIIASAIVASALVAGGSAFAQSAADTAANINMVGATQFFVTAQASQRVADRMPVANRIDPRAATSQGFAPVDTTNLSSGSSR